MDYFKKIERSVTISADKRSTVDLQVDVWSQDLNVTKFILKLDTTDSAAIDLTNATVRVAMVYSQDGKDVKIEAAGIVEDVDTQKIAYIMDDKLAGFEGLVIAGFYVTLNTGQRIDIQNVTFNMRKSLLDKDLEAATDNYYQTFDDIVADVQQTGDTAKTQIGQVLPDVQAEGEKVKTNINAVVSNVNGYADTQKQAIDNIVSDVQSTGNEAKEDIKATLPTLKTQINQLSESITEISDDVNQLVDDTNLIKLQNKTTVVNGVNVTTDKHGYITLNGTATAHGGRLTKVCKPFVLKAGVYTFSATSDFVLQKGSDTIVASATERGTTFTLDEDTEVFLGVTVAKDITYNATKSLMLNKGEYVPFIPSFYAKDFVAREKESALRTAFEQIGSLTGIFSYPTYEKVIGHYITNLGVIGDLSSTFYSSPISVKKGDSIFLRMVSYKSISAISKYDNGSYIPLVLGNPDDYTNYHDYYYTVKEDCEIVISGYTNKTEFIIVYQNVPKRFDDKKTVNVDFEVEKMGYYISSVGGKNPLADSAYSKPFKLYKGEKIEIHTKSYKIMSALAQKIGDSYKSLVVGNDNYTQFQDFDYVAEKDMIVCVSTYANAISNTKITITLVGSDDSRYDDVVENPLDNIIHDGGLTSVFKNIGCIGDSLASGEVVGIGTDGNLHSEDKYEFSWGQRIAKLTGNNAFNFSIGGLTTRTWLGRYGVGGSKASEFETNKCEAYIVALGQNDSYPDARLVPVGNVSDIGTDADTYYANYYKIIQRIKSIQPKAKIFVMTNPYPRSWSYDGYDDAVRYMAEHYENVFLVDFQKYAKDFYTDKQLWFSAHMTAVGYQQSAWWISTYIDWIIRNNMDKFRDVQWIGTEYTVPNA